MWDGGPAFAREALGSIVDNVVVADRRLAGWYNIQIGHTFELEGDGESAAKQYSQARARIHHILALPFPATFESLARKHQPKTLLHQRLLEVFNNDIRVQNDHINRYERMILPLFDSKASSGQHEEALRSFGELLGFDASRPEQEADNGSTLDVLWRAPDTHQAILFELKTKKGGEKAINKIDVGQGFNHLQWAEDTITDSKILGLIFVSYTQERTREASPSDLMSVATLDRYRALYDETIQMLLALQRMKPLDRYGEIEALCTRVEWQPKAVFQRLRGSRLLDVRK